MSLPNHIEPGSATSADGHNRLIEGIRGTELRGPGIARRGGGTLLMPRPTGLDPAGPRMMPAGLFPFKVSDASDETAAQVRVRFGQVNSMTPTIDDGGLVALDSDPAPVLGVVSGVVYLDLTLDEETGETTAAEVKSAGTLPAQTLTHAYLTLATVTVTGDAVTAINQAVTHSLGHRRCGVNDHHFWGL